MAMDAFSLKMKILHYTIDDSSSHHIFRFLLSQTAGVFCNNHFLGEEDSSYKRHVNHMMKAHLYKGQLGQIGSSPCIFGLT